jgi:hypothetical protein
MASVAGRCPASGVHPSGVVVPDPAVQPSGVQPVRCPVTWVRRPGVRRSGRLRSTRPVSSPLVSTRPASSRLVSARRSRCVRLLPYRAVALGPGRCGGHPSPRERVESRWAAAPLSGSVDGPAGPDASGAADSGVGQPGRRWRTRAPVGYGGGACPLSDHARPACGAPVAGGGARHRMRLRREVADLLRGCRRGWAATTVGGSREACRPSGRARRGRGACWREWVCGPSAAQGGSQRSRLAAGSALTCEDESWACQDLNQRPHPYQVSRAKRCAQGRFPRSSLSVRGEGMRS